MVSAMDKIKSKAGSGGWGYNFKVRLVLIVMTFEQKLKEVRNIAMKISQVRMYQRERVAHENVYWRNSRDQSVSPCALSAI